MQPNNQQSQQLDSSSLPQLQGSQPQPVLATQPQQPMGLTTEQASERARQLVVQYQNSPRQLAEAIAQLKSQYIQEQFNVMPNSADQ